MNASRRWLGLALLLGALQIASVVDCSTFVQVVSSDHPHAWRTVVDGGHVDLILCHESGRSFGGGEPRLHPKDAEDHVVHLAPDESAAAQKRPVESLAASPPASPPRLSAPAARPRPPEFVLSRGAGPFSRRSVVLRT